MAILPSTQRVGRLMWGRTRTTGDSSNVAGVVEGDFTDATIPTDDQANEIIALAAMSFLDVTGFVGRHETGADEAWPQELQDLATAAIAYQAAADIETSFYADETVQDPANRDYYQARANQLRAVLITAIGEWRGTGETGEPAITGDYHVDPLLVLAYPGIAGNRTYPTTTDGTIVWPVPGWGSGWGSGLGVF